MMNCYYFGETDKPLLGIYHPPNGGQPRDTAVLLCYPIAQEYVRCHWAFRRLASRLSAAGFGVFRFDYYGVGDSAGDSEAGRVAQWRQDIVAAAQELLDNAGVRRLSVVGLRLGAALAATTALDAIPIKHLVLWDPVVRGTEYLAELTVLHRAMLGDGERFLQPRRQGEDPELLGFPFPPALCQELKQINLLEQLATPAEQISLVVSEPQAPCKALRAQLASEDRLSGYYDVHEYCDWDKVESLENILVHNAALGQIEAIVTGAAA